MPVARGPFDVKGTTVPLHEAGQHPMLARLTIDKRFHGELDAASHGEMLSAGTVVKGSAVISGKDHAYEFEYTLSPGA